MIHAVARRAILLSVRAWSIYETCTGTGSNPPNFISETGKQFCWVYQVGEWSNCSLLVSTHSQHMSLTITSNGHFDFYRSQSVGERTSKEQLQYPSILIFYFGPAVFFEGMEI